MEIENAATAHTPKLLAGTHHSNYRSDTSDTVTGYEGVQVFVYRETDQRVFLQVNGPEGLLKRVVAHYKGNRDLCSPHECAPGRRSFVINY